MRHHLPLSVALLGMSLLPVSGQQELLGRRVDVIPAQAELVYEKGIKFLADTQTEKGNWSDGTGNDPGVVGLCIKAFLAHGEDPVNGPYSRHIQKAVSYIISQQNEANGMIWPSLYFDFFIRTSSFIFEKILPSRTANFRGDYR